MGRRQTTKKQKRELCSGLQCLLIGNHREDRAPTEVLLPTVPSWVQPRGTEDMVENTWSQHVRHSVGP